MDLHVSLDDRTRRTAGIYRAVQAAILDGRLPRGARLPSTRELAGQLGVARSTVTQAYERLTAEGFLVARVGAGTFVADETLRPGRSRRAPAGRVVSPRPFWRSLPSPTLDAGPAADAGPASAATSPTFDFGVGVPDGDLFPLDTWRRLVASELRSRRATSARYGPPAGTAELRAAIARRIGASRSVRASADDVIVTHGAQQAFDLVGRVLVGPGTRVAVEEPGYPPLRQVFASLGADVVGVPVDDEGLDAAALPDDAAVVCVTPSHQFPLGTPMSLARRAALLAWARDHDAVVVEDDYDSEFRFEDRPLEPLQHLDADGRVIYVGSFSKTMLPSLRLGFLVVPASLRAAVRAARWLTVGHGDPTTQRALARFIDGGELARHVRRATRLYAPRRERVLTAVRTTLAPWTSLVASAAGLHVCARLREHASVDLDAVLAAARRRSVHVESLAAYCAETPQAGLVIGFGAIQVEDVDRGLAVLADCFAGATV